MQKTTERFSDRVENYVRYRPGYPLELIDSLIECCQLDIHSTIADLGAGSGIFTRYLLERGLSVTAVEPNDKMRQAAESALVEFEQFSSLAGTGEATLLADSSIDLITVAQAFHWFDWPQSILEFKRILKPTGRLALIWNRRNLQSPTQQAYDNMLRRLATDYNEVNHMNIDDAEIAAIFSKESYRDKSFPYVQHLDCEFFLGRMQSSSYVPKPGTAELSTLIETAIALFEEYAIDGRLAFEYQSRLYCGKLI